MPTPMINGPATTGSASPSRAVERLVDWEFTDLARPGEVTPVRLPHDAMIVAPRGSDAPGGADTGWFHGGRYTYRARWTAAADIHGMDVSLFFEGVQGAATVTVNGAPAGTVRSGYHETRLRIDPLVNLGGVNEIVVAVDNSQQPASRWYPGGGLFRDVRVEVRPPIRLADDGVRFVTRKASAQAAGAEVSVSVHGAPSPQCEADVELRDRDGRLVATTRIAGDDAGRLTVAHPHLWSAETPYLYELTTRLSHAGEVVDVRRELVGLRTVEVDAHHGLRVNGTSVKLRGACIHHSNGILGAATHRDAEWRRVRSLKDAGFNAIRSAHHPMGRHLLDACDALGLYVMDELADHWALAKTTHDSSATFLETWRGDADAMIAKDRNRPSVIMYSIGNEIPDTATDRGVELAAQIAGHFRSADPTRPTTLATNLFVNVLGALGASPYKGAGASDDEKTAKHAPGSTEANIMVNQIGRMIELVSRLPVADRATRKSFAEVDIAGYNYGLARYRKDLSRYPNRVIVGSETMPGHVPRAWRLVTSNTAVIGDFVWVAWEYLGESGVGTWAPHRTTGFVKPYPYIMAGSGLIDLTGRPDFELRTAQAAWGTLAAPAIGVRPLDRSGQPTARVAWRFSDAVESWAWRGTEGRPAEIEVVSDAETVELVLNGRSLGRRRPRRGPGYTARFRARYEPGTLEAIAYRDGHVVGRTVLRSTEGDLRLRLTSEELSLRSDGDALLHLNLTIADESDVVECLADDDVTLAVEGPAELIGFGSARPDPVTPFHSTTQPTYRGRAQAILRSTGEAGTVRVTATSPLHGTTTITIDANRGAA